MKAFEGVWTLPNRIFAELVPVALAVALAVVLPRLSSAQTFQVLYTFTGGADGSVPSWQLDLHDGYIYGTAYYGGTSFGYAQGNGTVFQLDINTGRFSVLHTFAGWPWDGGNPDGGLIRDAAGNFFGTTLGGGSNNLGMVFRMNSTGAVTPLHTFSGLIGEFPIGSLVRDSAGNLYGVTRYGNIFKLDAAGTLTTLHTFTGQDGDLPNGTLLLENGNLYGTTLYGGANNCGMVFEVNAATGQTTVLYNFQGETDGGLPGVGVITDGQGNLYGTTSGGGSGGIGSSTSYGVVFKVNAATHLETVLYTFPLSRALGLNPGGLARDPQGNLYGTTLAGGSNGYGTVFKLDAAGNLTTLYNFTGGPDGTAPGGVVRSPIGNLYGTAIPLNDLGGTIFQITP